MTLTDRIQRAREVIEEARKRFEAVELVWPDAAGLIFRICDAALTSSTCSTCGHRR